MPTIDIKDGTLTLIENPDKEKWWQFLYRVLFTDKKARHPGEKSWLLSTFKSAEIAELDLPMSAMSLVKDGLTNRVFYVLYLCELHRDDTQVIASRDKGKMYEVYRKTVAAMGPNKTITASIHIENSTVVTGQVGGNASTNVKTGGDPPKQTS